MIKRLYSSILAKVIYLLGLIYSNDFIMVRLGMTILLLSYSIQCHFHLCSSSLNHRSHAAIKVD